MSSEIEVVTTEIEIKDAAVQQAGFGVTMIVGYMTGALLTAWRNTYGQNARSATFTSPDELTVAPLSMSTNHPIYRAAQKLMGQKPGPEKFKVGLRLGAITQSVRLTPSTPAIGEVFSLKVDDLAVSATGDATPTVAEICAALTSAIDGLATGVDAVDGSTFVTCNGLTAGDVHRYEDLTPNLSIENITANPATTIQTDLAAIRAYDSDWYGLVLDSNSESEINAAAAWAETQRILMFVTTADSGSKLAGTLTDVASDLRAAGYHRTILTYHHKPASQYAGAAWLGRCLHKTPGSFTFANKSLSGVDKSPLSDTERAALKGKNCNYYVDIKGIGFTLDGRAASGRYADITHGMDWFEVRLQERVVYVLANNDKVPFTDEGFQLFVTQAEAQILEGIRNGLIDGSAPWKVTVPKKKDINPNDVLARVLSGLKFDMVLQGAVHKVNWKGTVKVAF